MKNPDRERISRREFTISAALTAACVALPVQLPAQQEKPPATPSEAKPPQPQEEPKLSDAAKKEVELKAQSIMDRYGSKLSDSQKADIRKALAQTQEGLETLRAYPIENWDEPATVLHFNDAPATGARR
jgi:hypothetical protein